MSMYVPYVSPYVVVGMPIAALVGGFGLLIYVANYEPQEGPPLAIVMVGAFVGAIAWVFLLIIVAGVREEVEVWRAKRKSPK